MVALKSRTQTVPHFFCLAKRNGVRPKEKRFLPALGAVEPFAGGWVGGVLPDADIRALNLALARLTCLVLLRRLCRRYAFGLAVPLGFRLGAWPSSRVGAFIQPGAAAAALPPVRVWVAVPLGFGWDVYTTLMRCGCVGHCCTFPSYKQSPPL